MAYYTYVYYESDHDSRFGEYFNWLLVAPDQNIANILYRILLEKRSFWRVAPKVERTFTNIGRMSSNVWTYDSTDGEDFHYLGQALSGRPDTVMLNPDYKRVIGKVRVYWLGRYHERGLKMLPEIRSIDDDLLSGYSFFVRRRGASDASWFYERKDGTIRPSSGLWRSRFIITVRKANVDSKLPMVDDDEVMIEVVASSVSTKRLRLGVLDGGTLSVNAEPTWFKFRDFRSNFYTKWGDPLTVAWAENPGRAESYELSDGVEVDF
ncbi:hypothetical protein BBP40_009596 [Aspergillus hancockii]|nr:hypothetical protein BBP40_009596 [Aspergillus hancockii]